MSLGERISGLRQRRGWTQAHLAARTELSVTFLSEIENDRRGIGVGSLASIADALGASLDYLVRGGDRTPAEPVPVEAIVNDVRALAKERDALREIADAAWQCVALDEHNDVPWDEAWERLKVAVKEYRPANVDPLLVALHAQPNDR